MNKRVRFVENTIIVLLGVLAVSAVLQYWVVFTMVMLLLIPLFGLLK